MNLTQRNFKQESIISSLVAKSFCFLADHTFVDHRDAILFTSPNKYFDTPLWCHVVRDNKFYLYINGETGQGIDLDSKEFRETWLEDKNPLRNHEGNCKNCSKPPQWLVEKYETNLAGAP